MQWTTIIDNRLTEMMQWNSNQLHQIAAAAAEIQFALCYLLYKAIIVIGLAYTVRVYSLTLAAVFDDV